MIFSITDSKTLNMVKVVIGSLVLAFVALANIVTASSIPTDRRLLETSISVSGATPSCDMQSQNLVCQAQQPDERQKWASFNLYCAQLVAEGRHVPIFLQALPSLGIAKMWLGLS